MPNAVIVELSMNKKNITLHNIINDKNMVKNNAFLKVNIMN